MNYLHTQSLRLKISVAILLIAVLFLGLFQGYAYFSMKKKLSDELNELANSKAERLSRDLDLPLWELDEEWVRKILQSEMMDGSVHAIYVSGDQNFKIGLDKEKIHNGNDHLREDLIVRYAPVMHDGVKIGQITFYLSKNAMHKRVFDAFMTAVIVTVIETFVVITMLWIVLSRLILIPIDRLIESTKRIADGDYTHDKLDLNDDELGALSTSIDRMKRKIQRREDELNKSNAELNKVKEQLEYAISGTQDGLWDWNLETNEVYFSPRWKEMIGYRDDELPNRFESWSDNVHPDDLEKALQDVNDSHSTPGKFYENIHRMLHKDGSWVWILSRGLTIFDKTQKAVRMVGFHTNITKQKLLEAEVFEKEEMMISQSRHVAMGEMIGMIAHQWRQPITVIGMSANNMIADIELEDVVIENFKRDLEQILKQTEYLSKTIDDFRTFFRPDKEKDEIKIIDVFLEAKQIMGKSLENHNIELLLPPQNDERLWTYSRELLQVILNILKNAKEVLEEKKVSDPYIRVTIESAPDDVIVRVCDNGGGIDETLYERIFEPYFSTKDAKTGTGLGLYMSKTIVEKHLHGIIRACNDENGACFVLTLPREFKKGSDDE